MSRVVEKLPFPAVSWRRPEQKVELESVRRRLEILLTAMYGRHIPIAPPDSRREGWWTRTVRSLSPFKKPEMLPASDGESLRLPPALDASSGDAAAIARYRLLAIEQGERIVRGTAVVAARAVDSLERDLFLLRESAAIDSTIVRSTRNLAPALAEARARALDRRPVMESFFGAERDVEQLVRQLLAADPGSPPESVGGHGTAEDSLTWARERAARLRRATEPYRGVSPVDIWGSVLAPSPNAVAGTDSAFQNPLTSSKIFHLVELQGMEPGGRRKPVAAERGAQAEEPLPLSPAPSQQHAIAQDDDIGSSPAPGATDLDGGGSSGPAPADTIEPLKRDDVVYPEWDQATHQYRKGAVIVRVRQATEAAPDWATATLAEHAALVRRVRERFERLRARRTRLPRQREGDELDLAACVRAIVDAGSGHTVDDRLYVAVRPARRELAILLLVDISGSTDTLITKKLQVIDVEKIALLLAAEALDALGDRYAMLAFSGKGAKSVHVSTIKDFAERNGPAVRGRISALVPEANTRLGAAIRHATARLDAQSAGHRLLLILSDGKPNDIDTYQGPYGIEDSRQAINEARARDIYPFCLTVDQEDSAYLKRIFGPTGYAILPRPDHLPRVLLDVVRNLLGGN